MILPKLTQSALERIEEIRQKPENVQKFLRLSVSSGGCSGFQYIFALDDKRTDEDLVIQSDQNTVIAVTDNSSINFLEAAEIDFVRELGASYFKVTNPNASANCGCGSSFSV